MILNVRSGLPLECTFKLTGPCQVKQSNTVVNLVPESLAKAHLACRPAEQQTFGLVNDQLPTL